MTYVMRQGPTDLFSIDPATGVVKTIRGLDFEKEPQHTLIIGTEENTSNLPGATTKIVINVEVRKCVKIFTKLCKIWMIKY